MALYARHLAELHVIVLTRRAHGFIHPIHEGNLHLYPTHSLNRICMLIDAFRIAHGLLRSRVPETTITSQDPLELGLLSSILARLTHTPLSVQVHGDYYSPFWAHSFGQRLRRLLIPYVLQRADKVRVVSERVASSLAERGIPRERIVILPIRPQLESFLSATRMKPINIPFTVITASRFAREKNIPLLIRAFAKLHAQHPDTALRIVGDGEERSHIESVIARAHLKEAVRILPWSQSIEKEMVHADVFALASLHESYGLVLIEALATGVPVVTTDVGCAHDIVKNNEHGIIVPAHDERAFAEGLIRMYEDKAFRIQTSENGRILGKKLASEHEDIYAQKWVAAHTA
jgi:glycosyltransferase involved in cell wall biosynthesis